MNLSYPLDISLLEAEYQIFQFSIAESKDEDPYTVGDEEAWVDLNILVSRWGDGLNEYWRIPSIDELDQPTFRSHHYLLNTVRVIGKIMPPTRNSWKI